MNQINTGRYIKLFVVAVLLVSLTVTIIILRGVKKPIAPTIAVQKATTCNDVVFAYHVGEWNVPANPDGQTVKLSTINAWYSLSANARRSMARACAR